MLISENVQAGSENAGNVSHWSSVNLDGNWGVKGKYANGFGYFESSSDGKKINQDINENVSDADPSDSSVSKGAYSRPSSYHTGIVHAGFCDGHVISLKKID